MTTHPPAGEHHAAETRSPGQRREKLYLWPGYNPYTFRPRDIPTVTADLEELRQRRLPLKDFLQRTPQAATWQPEHVRQARILLVTQEPGLSRFEKLYSGLEDCSSAHEVAAAFHKSMLSWLALRNHPDLGVINGEPQWREGEGWEAVHPALAACGKIGYFLSREESRRLAHDKVLHVDVAPFAQRDRSDLNPRNSSLDAIGVHLRNCELVWEFVGHATIEHPRYLLLTGNQARIEEAAGGRHCLRVQAGALPDSADRLGLLVRQAVQSRAQVVIRLLTGWFDQGDAPVVELAEARVETNGDITYRPQQVGCRGSEK